MGSLSSFKVMNKEEEFVAVIRWLTISTLLLVVYGKETNLVILGAITFILGLIFSQPVAVLTCY